MDVCHTEAFELFLARFLLIHMIVRIVTNRVQ